MPEMTIDKDQSWKEILFWPMIVIAAIVTLSFTSAVWSRIKMEQPPTPTYRIIVQHESLPLVPPSPWVSERGKPDALTTSQVDGEVHVIPEWTKERSKEIHEIFENGRDPFERMK